MVFALSHSQYTTSPWASIARLFCTCCPSDITGLIVLIRIDAIKRQTGGTFTNFSKNVGDKIHGFHPTLTDFDTASAVIFIVSVVWIGATLKHHIPNEVEWVSSTTFGIAVDDAATFEASTRTGIFFKGMSPYNGSVSTITLAKPK